MSFRKPCHMPFRKLIPPFTLTAYQTLFKSTHRYKNIKQKNKHNKFFMMLKRNSFNVHWKFGTCQKWEPAGRIGDFGNFLNGFAKSLRVLRTFLNIEWVQFVLKNCEILHLVGGLYDKNSASYYCFTSDVIYKKYEMFIYTHPEFLARFC